MGIQSISHLYLSNICKKNCVSLYDYVLLPLLRMTLLMHNAHILSTICLIIKFNIPPFSLWCTAINSHFLNSLRKGSLWFTLDLLIRIQFKVSANATRNFVQFLTLISPISAFYFLLFILFLITHFTKMFCKLLYQVTPTFTFEFFNCMSNYHII